MIEGSEEVLLAKYLKPRTASVMTFGSGLSKEFHPGINVSNERIRDFCENPFHFLLLTGISGLKNTS
jgi:hypothetical protein